MFRFLVDTCVWLDIAKDPKQEPIVTVVEELVRRGLLGLIVPMVVIEEFERNRDRIARESAKSLSAHFRLVKEAISKVGGDKKRMQLVLSHLDDVDHKIPILGGNAAKTLDRIDKLLKAGQIVSASEGVKLRAADRAIAKRAPFHRGKNAMADAIAIETYGECVRSKAARGNRFAFVSHNKSEFSVENGNQKLPHPDFAPFFSRIKSLYFINVAEAIRRVEPSIVTSIMLENSWSQEPRGFREILEAEDLLFNQVWYNRDWNTRIGIEEGRVKLVDHETYPRREQTILRSVWKGALEAARKVERRIGKKNLGPWDDFGWGMVNGKLSALRWVLGDEWDMLDT